MGRFSDGGNYPRDIVKGAISKVRQIRIALLCLLYLYVDIHIK